MDGLTGELQIWSCICTTCVQGVDTIWIYENSDACFSVLGDEGRDGAGRNDRHEIMTVYTRAWGAPVEGRRPR